MPLYSFKCNKCDYVFDRIKKIGNDFDTCPLCYNDAKKQLSFSNFKINGYSEANGYAKSDRQ